MAYASLADVKTYLGVGASGDDQLIANLLARAQDAIDNHTRRVFEVSADTTRRFTVGADTEGNTLYFDEDICSITTVTTNADGVGSVIPSTEYITLPRNRTPYYAIRILDSSAHYWRYAGDAEMGITVAGKWAYSLAAPDDVVQACVRWAAYMYRQKDAQVFDTTAIPDAGVMMIPKGIPQDVKLLLAPYVKAQL